MLFFLSNSQMLYLPCSKCLNANECWHFNIYDRNKLHNQLRWACEKVFIIPRLEWPFAVRFQTVPKTQLSVTEAWPVPLLCIKCRVAHWITHTQTLATKSKKTTPFGKNIFYMHPKIIYAPTARVDWEKKITKSHFPTTQNTSIIKQEIQIFQECLAHVFIFSLMYWWCKTLQQFDFFYFFVVRLTPYAALSELGIGHLELFLYVHYCLSAFVHLSTRHNLLSLATPNI